MLKLWQDTELKKIAVMRDHHEQQVSKLESELESLPMEYTFSPGLMKAMKREEAVVKAAVHGNGGAGDAGGAAGLQQNFSAIAARVNQLFGEEMRTHFARQTKARVRSLAGLLREHEAERERLWRNLRASAQGLVARLHLHPNRGSLEKPSLSAVHAASADFSMVLGAEGYLNSVARSLDPEPANFARRFCPFLVAAPKADLRALTPLAQHAFHSVQCLHRALLDMHHEANERQALAAAFGTQRARVEAEWDVHEAGMTDNYLRQRRELEARMMDGGAEPSSADETKPQARRRGPRGNANNGRWLDKEKQSRLIHTAPVLAPTGVSLGDAAAPGAGVAREDIRNKLKDLELGYQMALQTLNVQKEQALLWIQRQEMRMSIQLQLVQEQFNLRGEARRAAALENFIMCHLVAAIAAGTTEMLEAEASAGVVLEANA